MQESPKAQLIYMRFAYADITARMVRTLDRIGPGGVIIADLAWGEFRVRHARRVLPTTSHHLVVYGHGELVEDLTTFTDTYGTQAWGYLAAVIDDNVRTDLAKWLSEAERTHHVAGSLRECLARWGFDRDARTEYSTVNGRRMFTDTYVDRTYPHLAVTLKVPADHPGKALSLIRVYDHGRHATGWPQHIPNERCANTIAAHVREGVNTYLARTRP